VTAVVPALCSVNAVAAALVIVLIVGVVIVGLVKVIGAFKPA
jgi:hypothetical protein